MRNRSYVPSTSIPASDRRAERIAELEAALADESAYALKLQIALTGLSGGGSENFVTHKGRPRADIPFCTQRIRERQDNTRRLAIGFAHEANALRVAVAPVRVYIERCKGASWLANRSDDERLLVACNAEGPAESVAITVGDLRAIATAAEVKRA